MSRFQLLPTIALLLATSLTGMPVTAQTSQNNTENTALHQLFERLLGLSDSTGQVLTGRLPNQLPVRLPLPEGSKVLGTVVRSSFENQNYQILLDATQSPQQVQAFYKQQLGQAGWLAQDFVQGENQGFFVQQNLEPSSNLPSRYCNPSQKAELMIEAIPPIPQPSTLTDVRLHLNVPNPTDLPVFDCSTRSINLTPAPLPPLPPPPNVQLSSGSNGGDEREYSANAVLESPIDAQALATHYVAQFEKAGWTRSDGGQDGAVVWQTLRFKDKTGQSWQGLLNITRLPGTTNRYTAYAQVSRR